MKALVIIPTYNEKENIRQIVEATLGLGLDGLSVLVVDDNSPDGTGAVADSLAAECPDKVFVMHRPGKQGLGSAYIQGFHWGLDHGYDAMCQMDADGQHDPKVLKRLIDIVASGADAAFGSRRVIGASVVGWDERRDWMSRMAVGLTRRALNLRVNDASSGFRCYSATTISSLLTRTFRNHGYGFQEEATFWCERMGCTVVEVPITFHFRRFGKSKLTPAEVMNFFLTICGLWLQVIRQRAACFWTGENQDLS